jgi:hypothetical protein
LFFKGRRVLKYYSSLSIARSAKRRITKILAPQTEFGGCIIQSICLVNVEAKINGGSEIHVTLVNPSGEKFIWNVHTMRCYKEETRWDAIPNLDPDFLFNWRIEQYGAEIPAP